MWSLWKANLLCNLIQIYIKLENLDYVYKTVDLKHNKKEY